MRSGTGRRSCCLLELLIIDENEFDHVNDKWKSKKFEDDKHKLEKHVIV